MKVLLDPDVSVALKYILTMEFVIWSIFDTSYGNYLDGYARGKLLNASLMIVGAAFITYLLVQIINILNTIHAPRTKYYEIINQLDAYMNKKQLPLHLQKRLKFFYKKKFRRFYYREDEILGILSGNLSGFVCLNKSLTPKYQLFNSLEPLQREMITNTGQLFVERVQLFKNVSKSLVSKIAASCKKEQFLPNDMVTFYRCLI